MALGVGNPGLIGGAGGAGGLGAGGLGGLTGTGSVGDNLTLGGVGNVSTGQAMERLGAATGNPLEMMAGAQDAAAGSAEMQLGQQANAAQAIQSLQTQLQTAAVEQGLVSMLSGLMTGQGGGGGFF